MEMSPVLNSLMNENSCNLDEIRAFNRRGLFLGGAPAAVVALRVSAIFSGAERRGQPDLAGKLHAHVSGARHSRARAVEHAGRPPRADLERIGNFAVSGRSSHHRQAASRSADRSPDGAATPAMA